MNGTEHFTRVITDFLNERALTDSLFANNLKKENKNIDDCINYILTQVKNSGCNGFADDEIFSMAIHYYDEDNISLGEKINGQVIVNHHIELTAEEKEEARKKAIENYQEELQRKLYQNLEKPKKVNKIEQNQSSSMPTLF